MYISTNWIKDYVDLDGVDLEKLISRFTMSVAEVEGIEYKGKDYSGLKTAKILSVDEVPNSKKLHLLKVDCGEDAPVQIVCGAPNVRVGLVTVLATVGAKLKDITISKATLAGLESYGMCCGGDEIGISDDHSGIVELPSDTPIGVDAKTVLPMEDLIFEVDNKSLTNRPDLWGHYGIAREIAALVDRPLKPLKVEAQENFKGNKAEVVVTSKNCNRYTTASMKNVTRKKSTLEMQIRLFYCGMRGINMLADVTNYVMLELGQPMHAFDGGKVNKIEVKDLENDETFRTLDGQERSLVKNSMVIATNGKTVALAGIMGGENSEITDDTTSVLIESANFDAYTVRKTALSLGMRTEASARYEKSLDPELTITALLRYVYLVKNMDKDAVISSDICDIYKNKYPELKVKITKDYIDNFVGLNLPEEKILKILTSLEFKLLGSNNGEYEFSVPTFRATKDINGKADLVEEITRVYGYDNIPPKSLAQPLKPSPLDPAIKLEYDTKYALADRFNMHETHSYIWYDVTTNKTLNIAPFSVIRCVNSINVENDKIRSTMVPSLLKVVLDNKGTYNNFATFEMGRVVKQMRPDNLADETKSLGVVKYNKTGDIKIELMEIKDVLDYLFEYIFKLPFALKNVTPAVNYYHPKNYYEIVVNGKTVGDVFTLHPQNSQFIGDDATVVGFEINFTELVKNAPLETKFAQISKFPTTKLDFNFIIPKGKLFGDINDIATSIDTGLNYNVSLLDIYENKDGTKSYTLHYEVNSLERTLTTEDIENFHSAVIEKFKSNNIALKI